MRHKPNSIFQLVSDETTGLSGGYHCATYECPACGNQRSEHYRPETKAPQTRHLYCPICDFD